MTAVLAYVPSLTTVGTRYAIRQFPDGLACDCQAFANGSVDESTDKHIAIYKAAQHALDRCLTAGHWDRESLDYVHGICEQCLVDLLAVSTAKVRRRYVPKEVVAEVKAKARATIHDIRARKKKR